jgi:hypothetical protein
MALFASKKSSAKSLSFPSPWLRELPLLLVPGDAWGFLGSSAAPESFAELARRLGDATRLAAYAAFLGMTEEKQLGLCNFFLNGIRTVKN